MVRLWLALALGVGLIPSGDPLWAADPRAVGWLREYIQIDTTNPPGNEGAAVAFLAQILEREGIASQVLTSPGGRSSLYARLPASGAGASAALPSEGAVVLLHHIDVVAADDSWRVEPFSGRPFEGKVWGRGALDVKGLGIAQLAAILALKDEGLPRQRDIVFLAVADEEAGGREGAAWLLEAHPELFAGVAGVLNEGGSNRVLNDRVIWWGIEVTQKRPLWLTVTATGRGGHASGLRPRSATHRLVEALARLVERPLQLR
ncbi:MAG: M20/M25/M40 family metallo-hydrolase, partial [Acidobacteriota bacterium]